MNQAEELLMQDYDPDIEEAIFQGLNNKERRTIVKIIKLAKDGAIYSDILGETGLNSGSLNYHLRQLEGLISKNTQGRYILTPLGEKALRALYSMSEHLENGYEEYLKKAKKTQKRSYFLVFAGTLTIFASCLSFVLGMGGIGMGMSILDGIQWGDPREIIWLLIAAFAYPTLALGLWAGISAIRRNRSTFTLLVNGSLLVPAVASTITFYVTTGDDFTGSLLAMTLGLPMIIALILSIFLILKTRVEFK
jgi:predicted transcriptional regulator